MYAKMAKTLKKKWKNTEIGRLVNEGELVSKCMSKVSKLFVEEI